MRPAAFVSPLIPTGLLGLFDLDMIISKSNVMSTFFLKIMCKRFHRHCLALLLRGIPALLTLPLSTADCYFPCSPGDFTFLNSFPFHRKLLFPLLSGGFHLP